LKTQNYIALSFDDGTLFQYSAIKNTPAIKKYRVPCTVFCTTHLRKHPHKNDCLLASFPEKIRDLSNSGHEIGSHTCTHPNLTEITSKQLHFELQESKRKLEEITGQEIRGFAYPYSTYNRQIVEEIKTNYKYARSGGAFCQDKWNVKTSDPYQIGSLGIKETFAKISLNTSKSQSDSLFVIMLHNASPLILEFLIYYFVISLPNFRFVTMTEIANMIYRRSNKV
jgi:peptidoglycan/xylan/chitin deacetylase (PgdA/CDA1 family)